MVRGKMQLELYRTGSDVPAVVGTDYVTWIDGRWSRDRAVAHLEAMAADITERTGLEWRRSVYLLEQRYRSVTI
jgi:hypothetical protein